MSKSFTSAAQRVREFPNQGLVSKNGKLECTICSTVLDYEKKSTVEDGAFAYACDKHGVGTNANGLR